MSSYTPPLVGAVRLIWERFIRLHFFRIGITGKKDSCPLKNYLVRNVTNVATVTKVIFVRVSFQVTMGIHVLDRVHVSPLGYEFDRVLEPAVDYKADSVYLLEHEEPDGEKPEYHATLKADLRDAGITVHSVQCDIFDLYTVLGEIAQIIKRHAKDEVYVNLSTGSKISAIGGMIACMVTRGSANVTPYYVRAEGYASDDDVDEGAPVSFGMAAITELPAYPIQGPSKEEIVILQFIAEEQPITKKQLIRQARQVVDRFKQNAEDKEIQIDSDPYMGEYRLLDTHILEPLQKRECVKITEVGRSKEIQITEEGQNTLKAFEYLLNG
ncbi:HFX_2341 family transcriptional regulator domain-containing protein [Haloferax volcanii]|uniref:HFX_2341 family transcriptional regulator domain-containing protein n=1 Tax=Haloferax volcanii TaxID=2246 RepID=UPI00249A86F4|nr:DUF6293 family protein [Haloferax alexandrinus]